MTQKDRISKFVSNLLNNGTSKDQEMCILGADERSGTVPNTVCHNKKPESCGFNSENCTNGKYACDISVNDKQCNTLDIVDPSNIWYESCAQG